MYYSFVWHYKITSSYKTWNTSLVVLPHYFLLIVIYIVIFVDVTCGCQQYFCFLFYVCVVCVALWLYEGVFWRWLIWAETCKDSKTDLLVCITLSSALVTKTIVTVRMSRIQKLKATYRIVWPPCSMQKRKLIFSTSIITQHFRTLSIKWR